MYPEIRLIKFLKSTERNDKGFGEMDTNSSVKWTVLAHRES